MKRLTPAPRPVKPDFDPLVDYPTDIERIVTAAANLGFKVTLRDAAELWRRHAGVAAGAGHGGMDWFVVNAFVEALKAAAPMPIDIYDAVAWSAITPLSEQSIAQ
ncbi:MAG: hypothetical protein LCH90_22880, partial [Proteobacteria bacterium]|nr:hypothetical protein [Pseudomonadota bacterium]